MSTLKVAAINNPSAPSGGLAISTSGNVTGAGLDLIVTQSFSAVSSVSVNNCFTSTYENYMIVYSGVTVASGSTAVAMRLRSSGADETGASNYIEQYIAASAGTIVAGRTTSSSWVDMIGQAQTSAGTAGIVNIFRPYAAVPTVFAMKQARLDSNAYFFDLSGQHTLSSSYDGFSLIPATSTITGTLRVYGYRN